MARALTARAVEAARGDPERRREIPDGGLPGLYLVVQPGGARSWAVRYRHAGRPRKLTIGTYPAFSLKEAREAASAVLRRASEGGDPASERRAAQADRTRDLFCTVTEQFLKRHMHARRRPRYAAEVERMLHRDVLPLWGSRRIGDITRRDVLDLLDGITDAGRGLAANRVFAAVRKLFSWAIERDIIETSPCHGVRPPAEERRRDRVLDDAELKALWEACGELGYPFGPMVQLLVLTGQRRSEVAGMTRDEITDNLWTIPGERAKNGRPHDVPLSDPALAIISSLPVIRPGDGAPPYLFTTNARMPVSGFSRVKRDLEAMVAKELGTEVPRWTLHDLRRTMASGMARLGISLPVIEKVLNHTSGSFGGIVGVYQRHEYAGEKRDALEVWARHVEAVTRDGEANVVPLRRAAP